MERELDRTRAIVASLRGLLAPDDRPRVSAAHCPSCRGGRDHRAGRPRRHRRLVRPDLHRPLHRCRPPAVPPAGPGGALYGEEFFTEAIGEVTAYVPVRRSRRPHHDRPRSPGGPLRRRRPRRPVHRLRQDLRAPSAPTSPSTGRPRPGPIREIYLVEPTRHRRRGRASAPRCAGRSPPDRRPITSVKEHHHDQHTITPRPDRHRLPPTPPSSPASGRRLLERPLVDGANQFFAVIPPAPDGSVPGPDVPGGARAAAGQEPACTWIWSATTGRRRSSGRSPWARPSRRLRRVRHAVDDPGRPGGQRLRHRRPARGSHPQ